MNRCLSIICAMLAIVGASPCSFAQEKEAVTLKSLEFQMEVLQADQRQPLVDLKTQYDSALERLQTSEQEAGNLESVLGIKKEREALADGSIRTAGPPSLERLVSLRKIYLDQRQKIGDEIARDVTKLLGKYLTSLESLKTELTKTGEIEEAMKVAKKIESVEAQREALAAGRIEPDVQKLGSPDAEVIVGGRSKPTSSNELTAEKEGEAWVLTSSTNHAHISSRKSYTVPFRIEARASTDSTNIRFYFAQKGRVIFNWERNTDELRIHNPVTGENFGFKGDGEVDLDEMHDFVIEVEADRVRVFVGRRVRGEIEGDFSDAEGIVGIGPAFGSRVSVEQFSVTQLKAED